MPEPEHKDRNNSRQSRVVAIVIAATILLWIGVQWLGGQLGWPIRYALLFDLAAMAAMIWALVVTWQIWRNRSKDG
ncbi:MAG: DUF5337 domain-containing protein [Pseudomonadota bacterium]